VTAAHAVTTNLPAGLLIGDQDGIRVSVDGEYFINAEGLEPGDVITKRLVIMNTEPYAYRLAMTAVPLEEVGPLRLLDEVHCTLRLDGRTLYSGRVRGDEGINMIINALNLGTYQSGQQRTLEITLTVNPGMEVYYWSSSEAFFKWNFYAVHDVETPGPKTGEIIKDTLHIILLGLALFWGILLLIKGRRKKDDHSSEATSTR